MAGLRIESNSFGRTIQIAGHYIPADSALSVRWSSVDILRANGYVRLKRERASDTKTQVSEVCSPS